MRRFALALVHHPVLDRAGAVATTTITTIDLHDLARSALTFGAEAVFVTHPVHAQRELAERVRAHWVEGSGSARIPDRKPAMELVRVVPRLEDAVAELGPGPVDVWTTSARAAGADATWTSARAALAAAGPPVLVVFGTGWGLAADVTQPAALRLPPIEGAGPGGYNHLSVRAAAAIVLDRLRGEDRRETRQGT